jgi:hypothetical protein
MDDLIRRLREHNDSRLYREADLLMHEGANALEARQAPLTDSAICTCPSGDGSLRWPCPAHPAPAVPEAIDAAMKPKEGM